MFGFLIHRLVPASLYAGQTAFASVSEIDEQLRRCDGGGEAIAVLDRAKLHLYALMERRFRPAEALALTLKILNLLLGRRQFRARYATLAAKPFGLVVDPSNACRLACPGCVHSPRVESLKLFDWAPATLSQDRFARLLRLYGPYAIGAYFCNYGEPLLNRRAPTFIRMAKCHLMWTGLSTSLSVERFDAEAYVESGLDFMALSIDGATQSVYGRYRRNGNLQLVLENIRALVEAKRRLGRRAPLLCWNFLAFEHNRHEIDVAARIARKLGVDQFRVAIPFDVSWDDPEIRPARVRPALRRFHRLSLFSHPSNWNPFPEAINEGALARAFGNSWTAGAPEPPNPGATCHWLYKNIVMDAAGRILPCCSAPGPDRDLVFATLDGDGGDPFNSAKHRRARSILAGAALSGGNEPHCARCEWDHTAVNIGARHITSYFRASDAAFFDGRSLRLLADW
ncbi:MAG: radical SAM protein [Bryobacteraceae bacterium]|nr:radical SAM protein [Bryobacteraceae bacterium]